MMGFAVSGNPFPCGGHPVGPPYFHCCRRCCGVVVSPRPPGVAQVGRVVATYRKRSGRSAGLADRGGRFTLPAAALWGVASPAVLPRVGLVYSIDPPVFYPRLAVRTAAFFVDFGLLVLVDAVAAVSLPLGCLVDLDEQRVGSSSSGSGSSSVSRTTRIAESPRHGATPGARACHPKVLDAEAGKCLTFSQAVPALCLAVLSAAVFGLGQLPVVGILSAVCCRDLSSGCLVVRLEPSDVV